MAQDEKQEVIITISVNDIGIIMTALTKRPYEEVADIIAKIHVQAAPQITPK